MNLPRAASRWGAWGVADSFNNSRENGTARHKSKWRAVPKSAEVKHFPIGTPHSAPIRQMATCGKNPEEKCKPLVFGEPLARCGYPKQPLLRIAVSAGSLPDFPPPGRRR